LLAPTAFRSLVSRAKREVVDGVLNNRYANGRFAQNEEISIFFDRNFASWAITRREHDNLWQGGNDAFRQMTQPGAGAV